MEARMYDMVVFGATGYTGRWVVEYLVKHHEGEALKWAVAGRDSSKLDRTLDSVAKQVGESSLERIDKIVCNADDDLSMLNMAEKASVVLNCAGPYRFSGEAVVRACVAKGTNYVDVSGEPEFLELIQLKYHEEAKKKGIYIVGSCGFDSIPADMGVAEARKAMGGPIDSVEVYVRVANEGPVKGPSINFATWQSAIYGVANRDKLRSIRRQLFPEKLPEPQPKLESRGLLHRSNLFMRNRWCLRVPVADESVIRRSERARYHNEGKSPAPAKLYYQFSSCLEALGVLILGGIFLLLANLRVGRYLLESYPLLLSGGLVTKECPRRESVENMNFVMTLIATGGEVKGLVNVLVKGKGAGYGTTSECLIQAALAILREKDRMPSTGGVYTPGYAFEKTSLVEKLTQRGVTFTTVTSGVSTTD